AEPRPRGLTYTVARAGEPIIVEDTSRHPLYADTPWSPFAIIGVPLKIGSTVVGVMNVAYPAPHRFTESELRLLSLLAAQAAIAVHNARLHDQVQRHAAELEQRVAERTAELDRQRRLMQAILDAAGEGIVFTDLDARIEYLNPAMQRITGYSAADALGQNPRIWQSGRTPLSVYKEMWSAITHGEAWQGDIVNRRKDGTLYHAAMTAAPLTDANGQARGYVGVQRDITRQKELDHLKDLFVSNVSHELRTPLTNIKLYLGLLEHGRSDKRGLYMETLNRETARLEKLINDLLDLSRLDLGTVPIHMVATDVNRLAADLITDRAALASARGISLDCIPDADLPPALADSAMIAQVMSNLLANAVNYTPAGGLVTVTSGVRHDADGDWVTFTVQDTGPGISADDIPHVFGRFYRGLAGRGSGVPGTGLGLAICKEIVDRLEGRITVNSPPGEGTAFTVWLRPARGDPA
ncbi:MAG TPA: ATP-binding protein, partial [Anaerolineae bacterium]